MKYVKINRQEARKLHEEGDSVYLLPSKANINSVWWEPAELDKEQDFDKFISEYRFYNCNKETGKGIIFYKEEERFEPRQRTAIDENVWWVVYDKFSQKYSTLTCFGKYRTKKDCLTAIKLYKEN
jgi:hypothetical protein